jgi:lantibiotic modifying enzyme
MTLTAVPSGLGRASSRRGSIQLAPTWSQNQVIYINSNDEIEGWRDPALVAERSRISQERPGPPGVFARVSDRCDEGIMDPTECREASAAAVRAAATKIGTTLCDTAFWDASGRECNWLGSRDVEDALTAPYTERYAALSQELYSGSCGVAMFLGELAAVDDDPRVRETAFAALRRSIRYCRERPSPAFPLSLYAGHLGLLYAAVRMDAVNRGGAFADESTWLFEEARRSRQVPHPYDIIGGNAGAILALLFIADEFRSSDCLALALEMGEELCQTARWAEGSCVWVSAGGYAELPPMTGLSHGASGIAVALLRLYELTKDRRFLDTARGAYAFEDGLYNPAEKNWVDTRYEYTRDAGGPVGRFRLSWCHGAPGIALSRSLASRLDPERAEVHAQLAHSALDTASIAIESGLRNLRDDASLCHGLAGLSEVLLVSGEILGEPHYRQLAAATASELVRRYSYSQDWPSGLQTKAYSPCLMVGTSGVGIHLLRLTSPTPIPSPLLPGLLSTTLRC